MGIIRALAGAIGGGLADQWLEVYESDYMGPSTITAPGVMVRQNDSRNSNRKGTADTISNGSIIQVKEGQFMLLVDGGKVIDYSSEAGYFKVDNSSMPSLFNGELGDTIKETFNRVRFSGTTPYKQTTYFLNMQEIRGLKFGTPAPVNYFANFYNAELFLRAHGSYTIRITDPLKFYVQVADHDADSSIDVADMSEQYRNEFLTAFQTALNKMSSDGQRISFVLSRGDDLAKYMQDVLDEKWQELRGFQVESVAIASISYDEESQKLINMRNQGAMLGDPNVREGYVQGAVARGMEAAGSNSAGSMAGFMGMGLGMNAGGGFVGAASQANQAQREAAARSVEPSPAAPETASDDWTCSCGALNHGGKFCPNCGTPRPTVRFCTNCGEKLSPNAKFCPNCGTKAE